MSADHKVDAIPGFFLNGLIRFTDSVEYNTPNKFRTDPYTVLNWGIRYETKLREMEKRGGGFRQQDLINTQKLPAWNHLNVGARYSTKLNGYPVTWRVGINNLTKPIGKQEDRTL